MLEAMLSALDEGSLLKSPLSGKNEVVRQGLSAGRQPLKLSEANLGCSPGQTRRASASCILSTEAEQGLLAKGVGAR